MIRTGIGFDAHRFAEGRPLVLGGVTIEHSRGLLGHSDADVLTHAIADALLGSMALGDIGKHFPDSDPQWRGASSIHLLEQIVSMVTAKGAKIINIDATVIAEQPKLSGVIDEMRAKLGDALNIDVGFVSVKATTVEQMGAFGRREGVGAMAVVTVDQQ